MHHATQVALIRRILDHLDAGSTDFAGAAFVNDASVYTSPDRLQRERTRLLRREPLFVGLSTEAPEPGSWFEHDVGEVPVLVVRQRDGTLRACANICRHRGAKVASGSGRGPALFTCPFHGWTYDEAGQLVSQPCREGFAGLDAAQTSLLELPVGERHGMVFVRPEPGDPVDVDACLGGAEAELAPFGLERHVLFARQTMERPMNWKLVIDSFLEAYHVPVLHERSLGPTILGHAALWDPFGRGGRMIATRRSVAELRGRREDGWELLPHAVILYNLFPSTIAIYQVDHLEVVQAFPVGNEPGRSRIVFSLYTPGPADNEKARRHFQKNFDLLVGVIDREDFEIAAGAQRSMETGLAAEVVYGRNEPGLAHFHGSMAAALDEGASRPPPASPAPAA